MRTTIETMDNIQATRIRKAKRTAGYVLRLLLGILFILPLLMGFVFSFVDSDLLFLVPTFKEAVTNLTLDNYRWVLHYLPIGRYLFNTLVVSFAAVIGSTVLCSMAAYAFAFFNFPGRNFLFNLILVAMMIPGDVVIITNFLQIQNWGLLNTYSGLFITSLVAGTSIFLIRQYFLQMPRELSEAAVIDGCGTWRFMFQIAMPMATPAIVSLAVTGFISAYNMYFWPLLVSQTTDMQTIQIGMSMLVGMENTSYGPVMAGAVLCAVVPVILFIFAQDHIIKGMSAGAIKG